MKLAARRKHACRLATSLLRLDWPSPAVVRWVLSRSWPKDVPKSRLREVVVDHQVGVGAK
jgi:hypothetical protein